MDKLYSKVNKPLQRAVTAVRSYLEAELAGVRVIAAALNLFTRSIKYAQARSDPLYAGRIVGPLLLFADAVPRLCARHIAETNKQLAQVRTVVNTLQACQAALHAAVDDVLDAVAKCGAVRTASATPEYPLSPLQLRSLAVALRRVVAADLLCKLEVAATFERLGAAAHLHRVSEGSTPPDVAQWIAHFDAFALAWCTGSHALGVDCGLETPSGGSAADAPTATLAALWQRASVLVWKHSGVALQEPLLAASRSTDASTTAAGTGAGATSPSASGSVDVVEESDT